MICPTCGSTLPDGAAFCANCGTLLASAQQPQPEPQPQPGPQPEYGFPTQPASPLSPASKKSKTPLIIGIVAGVVVLVAAVLVTIFLVLPALSGGSDAKKDSGPKAPADVHASADAVAEELTSGVDDLISDGFSANALAGGMDRLLELVPEDASDALLDEVGLSRDDLREGLDDVTNSMMGLGDVSLILDYFDIEMTFEVGDEMSERELDEVNDTFAEIGADDVEATSGYQLSAEMSMTALEDMYGIDEGDTESESVDETGIYAIEVDGSWYVWAIV